MSNLKVIFGREPWWAEFCSALASLGWSGISILSYQPLSERPIFAILDRITGPHFWEVGGLVIGIFQLSALLTGCTFGRGTASFVSGWWWLFLTFAIVMQDPATPSIALYAVFGAINIFSMLKMAGRYG